jgi:hypothetical protein
MAYPEFGRGQPAPAAYKIYARADTADQRTHSSRSELWGDCCCRRGYRGHAEGHLLEVGHH